MTSNKYLKYLGISVVFYALLASVFLIYLFYNNSFNILTESNLLHFDAALYEKIKINGYYEDWLCAFFPAFPFTWKLLNFSALGITILNSIIFIFSISALSMTYKFDWKQHLFFLSIPSIIFMFLPYTESFFFTSTTILLIGFKKNKMLLILIGLFLASLIRPTTFIFIPAILTSYFFIELNLKQSLKKSIIPSMILILGLLTTVVIHFSYTGKWFVFFEAQKLWKNYLHFPTLPLTSWGGDGSVRFDGSALAISIICGAYLVSIFSRKVKNTNPISKDLIFSTFYIFGTSFLILAYRDGNLYSLNRFIYSTPFITIAVYYFFLNYTFKWNHVLFLFISTELLWLLFGSYNHIHNLLLFTTVSLYFSLILLSKHLSKIISNLSIICLILINCIGMIKLYCRFLNDVWIG
jgi:hypothetical protein